MSSLTFTFQCHDVELDNESNDSIVSKCFNIYLNKINNMEFERLISRVIEMKKLNDVEWIVGVLGQSQIDPVKIKLLFKHAFLNHRLDIIKCLYSMTNSRSITIDFDDLMYDLAVSGIEYNNLETMIREFDWLMNNHLLNLGKIMKLLLRSESNVQVMLSSTIDPDIVRDNLDICIELVKHLRPRKPKWFFDSFGVHSKEFLKLNFQGVVAALVSNDEIDKLSSSGVTLQMLTSFKLDSLISFKTDVWNYIVFVDKFGITRDRLESFNIQSIFDPDWNLTPMVAHWFFTFYDISLDDILKDDWYILQQLCIRGMTDVIRWIVRKHDIREDDLVTVDFNELRVQYDKAEEMRGDGCLSNMPGTTFDVFAKMFGFS